MAGTFLLSGSSARVLHTNTLNQPGFWSLMLLGVSESIPVPGIFAVGLIDKPAAPRRPAFVIDTRRTTSTCKARCSSLVGSQRIPSQCDAKAEESLDPVEAAVKIRASSVDPGLYELGLGLIGHG